MDGERVLDNWEAGTPAWGSLVECIGGLQGVCVGVKKKCICGQLFRGRKCWGSGMPQPESRARRQRGRVQNAASASSGTFCPELFKPSVLACQLSLHLPQGKAGIRAVWEPKRPRDITFATTLMICEVTQYYLPILGGEGPGS